MKNKIISLALASLLFTLPGCNEENFLNENPRDEIYAENLLVDYTGFESMIIALQGLMRHEYRRADAIYGSIPVVQHAAFAGGADNSFSNNSSSEMKFLYRPELIRETDADIFGATFTWLYRMVNTANMVIARAENPDVDWGGTTDVEIEANKNEIVAKARFYRAWAYRHLTFAFGPVPLSLEEIDGLTARDDWERNSLEEIRQVMEEDLQFAVDVLPMRFDNNNQVSQAMARHYLGELYLATDRPSDAVTVLRPLVEGSDYQLMTQPFGTDQATPDCPFIDVFMNPTYKNDKNLEVIYYFVNAESQESSAGTSNVYIKSTWKNYYVNDAVLKQACADAPEVTSGALTHPQIFWLVNGGKGAGRLAVTKGSIDLYDYKGQRDVDQRINEPAFVWTIYDKQADGSIVPFLVNGESPVSDELNDAMLDDTRTTIQNYKWPSTRKWDYVQKIETNGESDTHSGDVVYLRLSDTYLLYAEALYKTGNSGEAVTWINRVRNRANAVSITAADLNAGGLDLILDERSRELLAEEERRHTLIRVSQENGGDERALDNYFKRRTRQYNEIAGRDARGMNTYDVPALFPLPQSFIDSNTGYRIEQNPGY